MADSGTMMRTRQLNVIKNAERVAREQPCRLAIVNGCRRMYRDRSNDTFARTRVKKKAPRQVPRNSSAETIPSAVNAPLRPIIRRARILEHR